MQVGTLGDDACDMIRLSVRRASVVLQPRDDLVEARSAIENAVAWLGAVDAALSHCSRGGRVASLEMALCGAELSETDTLSCSVAELKERDQALHGATLRLSRSWAALVSGVQFRAEQTRREDELLHELRALHDRNAAFEAALEERRQETARLRSLIDIERRRAQEILEEQRWLVPTVAAAVQDMEELQPPVETFACSGSPSRQHFNVSSSSAFDFDPCLLSQDTCCCGRGNLCCCPRSVRAGR